VIAKKHRFRGHNSVAKVRGGAARSQHCSLYFAKNKKGSDYKMAVVVSKKVSKLAVERNRIRRRLYETVRTTQVFDGVSIQAVFVVHSDAIATMSQQELSATVTKLATKAAKDISTPR
jgi:ribonuclease P protein component